MDKSDLLSTLKASGLKLPMFYQIYPENAENFVHRMVPLLLNGHDAYIGTFGAEYANQLKKNLGDVLTELGLYPTSSISSLRAIYGLRDSAMLSPWNDKFLEYNCYAYAIGSERFRQPDGTNVPGIYNVNQDIEDIAKDVLKDLESRGQWGYIMNIKPSSLPDKWFKAICVRKDATYNQDYHFMKMNGSLNSWSHKPGISQPLQWLHKSPNVKMWTNEAMVRDQYRPPEVTYNSSIYYILYKDKNAPGIKPWTMSKDEISNLFSKLEVE